METEVVVPTLDLCTRTLKLGFPIKLTVIEGKTIVLPIDSFYDLLHGTSRILALRKLHLELVPLCFFKNRFHSAISMNLDETLAY